MLQIGAFMVVFEKQFAPVAKVAVDHTNDWLSKVSELVEKPLFDLFEVSSRDHMAIVSLVVVVDKHL